MVRLAQVALLAALSTFAAFSVAAQDQGPIAAPPKFEVNRIPAVPHPGPPPIPQQEIIQKFAANEDAMEKLYNSATFTEAIRLEELSDPGGKFTVTGQVYSKPDGGRFWRITQQPQNGLKITRYSLEDVQLMIQLPLFPLTSAEISNYNFLYAGQDKLDEINAYVFQVKPKQLTRQRKFFDGVIWVDDHDLTIVKTYGKFVSEIVTIEDAKLPFTMFETYRENFREKYWLPTYTTSDDFIDQPDAQPGPPNSQPNSQTNTPPTPQSSSQSDADQLHLRLVIRSTNFQFEAAAPPAPPPAPAPASPPATAPPNGSDLPDAPKPAPRVNPSR